MLGRFTNAARASSTLLGRSTAQTLQRPQLARLVAPTNLLPLRSASSSTREVKINGPGKLEVAFADGGKPANFEQVNTLWLRDNCQCSQCINQDTRQRNFDTFELSPELAPVSVNHTPTHVFVEWSDSHKSEHPWPWLETWFDKSNPSTFGRDHKTIRWTPSLADSPPEVSYKKIMDPNDTEGMAQLTRQIWQHGFTFIVDTPVTPEATEAVLEKIGPIRTTHYGGFYDFIPDLALADTAYTNLALPAHTDTTYFSEPAGLQAFHLLSHTPPPDAGQSGKQPLGGKSLLVDGFNAAQELKETHPESYKILRDSKIPWHASGNQGIAIVPDRTYPVIEEDESVLARVRWNNDDRGVVPPENAQAWYAAAAKWNAILRKKENEFWFQLKPGSVVIFNNWRIMHGRSAFDGVRRICGAYIPRDDFVSRYRTSNFSHEDVIGRNLHMNTKKV